MIFRITVRIPKDVHGQTLATASMELDHKLVMTGFRICRGQKDQKLFLSPPSLCTGTDDKGNPAYRRCVSFSSPSLTEKVTEAVLSGYHSARTKPKQSEEVLLEVPGSVMDYRMSMEEGCGKVKAFAALWIAEEVILDRFEIRSGKDGLYLKCPSFKWSNEIRDIIYFPNPELRQKVQRDLLELYQQSQSKKGETP